MEYSERVKIVKEFFNANKEKLSTEEWTSVIRVLNKIIESNSDVTVEQKKEAEEHKVKGNELFKEANFEEALKLYNKSLELDPTNYLVYSNRSLVLQKLGKDEEAIKDCVKGIGIEPTFVKFYLRLATLYEGKDDKKALEYVSKGLEYERDNKAFLEMKDRLEEKKTFDPSSLGSLLENPNITEMVKSFVKDKTPEELNEMISSVFGKLKKE
ncbi:hypothetical protein GINT2_000420 [Glugoides intestinalis]